MKKSLIPVISGILVLCVGFYTVVNSCSDYGTFDDYSFRLFTPDLGLSPTLTPFNYTHSYLNSYVPDPQGLDYQTNCKEWVANTKGQVNIKDVYTAQYELSPELFLNDASLNNYSQIKRNSFIKSLLLQENAEELKYFLFAKRVEANSYPTTDLWEDEKNNNYNDKSNILLEFAYKNIKTKGLSGFLKERYAFQIVKLLHYEWYYKSDSESDSTLIQNNANRIKLVVIYENYLLRHNSIVAKWALLYYGMAQTDTDKKTTALVQAFDQTEEKKVYVYKMIDKEAVLNLIYRTQDKSLKIAAMALLEFHNPGKSLTNTKNIAALDPNSKYLPTLIGREINKIEAWTQTPLYKGIETELYNVSSTGLAYTDANYGGDEYDKLIEIKTSSFNHDLNYMYELESFLSNLSLKQNADWSNYTKIAVIYLKQINGKYDQASVLLNEMTAKQLPKPFAAQLEKQRYINILNTVNIGSPQGKQDIYNQLMVLKNVLPKSSVYEYNFFNNNLNNDFSELLLMTSNKYKRINDDFTAGLLSELVEIYTNGVDINLPREDHYYYSLDYFNDYGTPAIFDELIVLNDKKNKTDFEKLISIVLPKSNDIIRDFKVSVLVRMNLMDIALAESKKIDDNYWDNRPEFKGNLPILKISDVGTLIPNQYIIRNKYDKVSKRSILQELVDLQNKKNKNPDDNFKLANCYYNISYNGRAWMLSKYQRSSYENGPEEKQLLASAKYDPYNQYQLLYSKRSYYDNNYYSLSKANKYYQLVANSKAPKELRAKAILMLSHLQSLRDGNSYNYGEEEKAKIWSPYLVLLRSEYRSTKLWQDAVTMCPDVAEYDKFKTGKKKKEVSE